MEALRRAVSVVCSESFQLQFTWKLVMFAFTYLNLWTLFGLQALPPNGTYFHLLMLFIAAHFSGKLSSFLRLPPLFGMLVAGFVYGNVVDPVMDKTTTSMLRSLALMVILLRAGLSLDPSAIRKLSFVCFRLAFVPCLVEAITVALCAMALFQLSLGWSLMLGFVLAAVSPAVVVPGMIRLQHTKRGVAKGIPTLIIAAASIDDVLAISGFSVCLGFAFTTQHSSLLWSLLKGPTEAVIGIVFGLVVGILLWYLPERCDPKDDQTDSKQESNHSSFHLHRFALLLLIGAFALFGSQKLDLGGAGPLAILVAPFVASLRWRPLGFVHFNEDSLRTLWTLLQHFLFCLIGADVRLRTLQSEVLLNGLVCLGIGIAFRIGAAFVVTYGVGYSGRERLYTAIAWLPKATVQAAIGPVALDMATTGEDMYRGRLVLTMAVLSILLTAPLGAIAIDYFAPILLSADQSIARRSDDEHQQCGENEDEENDATTTLEIGHG